MTNLNAQMRKKQESCRYESGFIHEGFIFFFLLYGSTQPSPNRGMKTVQNSSSHAIPKKTFIFVN